MNEVSFFNETKESLEEISRLPDLIQFAMAKEELKEVEFNVIFVDLDKITELNKTYRGLDRPTDVITFALEDETAMVFPGHRILGDIYICLPKASSQALEYGHSLERELSFLMIHGFYHLLGYDHQTKEEELIMFAKQEAILNEYGITR